MEDDEDDANAPFLAPSSSYARSTKKNSWIRIPCILLILLISLILIIFIVPRANMTAAAQSFDDMNGDVAPEIIYPKTHFLLPASKGNVQLCKTALSAAILDYPVPVLLGWNQSYHESEEMAGGSHMGKIINTLAYLNSLKSYQENDIVLMTDAYDVWFQLPLSVLLERYTRLNNEASDRLAKRLGVKTVNSNRIKQTIVFASGKRCAPNQPHTIACYPIPEPPIWEDLYFNNTDTIMGRNKYYSHRQKYLNSGYIIGPVGHMRKLFERALEKTDELLKGGKDDPNDNGSHGSDFIYHGSDQSIFNTILGEQEYMREVHRREQLSYVRRAVSRLPFLRSIAIRGGMIEGTIIDDILNPSFTHQKMDIVPGKQYEFGIGLDYLSDLGHQTVNSEQDARWLGYNRSLATQVTGRNLFDCKMRLLDLSSDILRSRHPFRIAGHGDSKTHIPTNITWKSVPLYTHLCFGTVPVMIHHNGNKNARNFKWPKIWFYPQLELMVKYLNKISIGSGRQQQTYQSFIHSNNSSPPNSATSVDRIAGAWIAKTKTFIKWQEMCSNAFDDGAIF